MMMMMMMMANRGACFVLSVLWSAAVVAAVRRADLFPYGTPSGDLTLAEGDDETSRVLTLPRPLYFYNSQFSELYVATNGIISAQDLPMEKQYVDDGFPTDFPVVAPFLADLDTSGGRGQIYYRLTETPGVLNRVSQEVHRGFPDAGFTPTHAVVATWENVGAYEEQSRQAGPTNQVNTFQAVIAYDETDSYALFLYPEDGLHFYGTRPKESYNVEIELPARVGFSRGEITYFLFSRQEGPHYAITSDQQSVKNLYQVGNTGSPGVWLFHIGNSFSFDNIVPAAVSGLLATPPPRGHQVNQDTTTPEYGEFEEYPDTNFDPENQEEEEEEEDYPVTTGDPEFQPRPSDRTPESPSEPGRPPHYPPEEGNAEPEVDGRRGDTTLASEPRYAPEGGHGRPGEQHPQSPLEVVDPYPPHHPNAPGGHVVSVEEEEVDFDTGVIHYSTDNKETCARYQNQCSQNAVCSDYPSGFCCHCQSGFYGNGRHCLPDGVPQRVSGKVRGTVTVGGAPVELGGVDLHAYIVVGDGRAYTAISEVPEPLGWALMPVAPIGELFGWLFALEIPDSEAGFKITGAEFTRHAEVIFYPGGERLTVVQTAGGLDEHNHLTVDTVVNGNVPFMPPGATVTMEPFKETYQYYPSVTTSASVREYSVASVERGAESFSFQLRQNLTHRHCRHDNRGGRPETLQVTVERVFVMYVTEERILRYAITNKIGPVGVEAGGSQLVNPCYSGSHDCDTAAQCLPSGGTEYQCECATGYQGDGRNCYDVDECVEGPDPCDPSAQCVNLPGSHRCQCHPGYEFGYDGRSCVDVDECRASPCHADAACTNEPGSFRCQCRPGFHGDGFHCSQHGARPKSPCEQHRDSVQDGLEPRGPRPVLRPFVPRCDADGRYRPLQCHDSTGQCWCVDSRGQERADTRTPPGASPTDCDKPDEPVPQKTPCEHHRDLVQTSSPDGRPLLGIFVPECDQVGQYRPQQCHAGYCWCVDSRGQERADTRTSPGETPIDCNKPDEPERPKTRCEHHRESIQTTGPDGHPIPGASVPQCDAHGQYTPLQCHGSTGHCWCVDAWGQEREGTRTLPGTPPTDCDKPDEPERPKTHCEHHRDGVQTTSPEGHPLLGAFVPGCDAEGQYKPLQCHGSTGHCWCVDNSGQEREGTRTPPGTATTDCSRPDEPERPKTHCEHHRDGVQTTSPEGYPILGAFVPECDAHGQYKPLQCHGSTGHCWCVDSSGQERAGTRTPPGTPAIDCDKPDEPERPKTHCEHHRDGVQTTSPEGYPILGAFVPECDVHGQYKPLQCHGSTGHCWCVDSSGQERAGTRTPPGTPAIDCDKPDEPERPKTHCEHHRDGVQTTSPEGYPILGAFVPECDAHGQYKLLQCHGSTGHCWCVDSWGQERAGTRTPPGTPTIDCDKPVEPERPKTHCQHHRDSVQTTGPDGHPILGAFVPQCDDNGQYTPLQCHGSTGHCWCVDSAGQERARTRTPPGTPPKDCDKPDEPERPKTHCEQHRDRVPTTTPEGLPLLGAFVPDCDEDGQYRPQQCHGSTGHCWCVDDRGQERAGTRTASGTPPRDCYKPDEPERPKTHCEHHRDGVQTTSPEGHPLLGAFVPECDAEGQYKTQQCHGSTGHCWCVDNSGQERAGTRTSAGTPRKDCDKPDTEPSRPESVCERWRASLVEHYGGKPEPQHYLPQCDVDGHFSPVQCYGDTSYCWCVDQDGREVEGTRSHNIVKPACIPTVAPPTMHPLPRPDVTPPPSDVTLLYAQGQQIGALPLNGTRLDPTRAKTLLALHGSIVVGVAYDCQEDQVYWSDLSGRTISRASLTPGAEPEILINTDLTSPEGLAVDASRRLMFWVDSAPDKIERANLDGSGRRTLFHRDLVNPRAIIVVSSTGTLFWTDWNREAPKIERSTVDGGDRKVVVNEGVGLPNALTYDPVAGQICWADAGTKRLECVSPDGSGRRVIHPDLNYPFSMVYYRDHFYYSDWRRDGVIAVSRDSSKFTDEFLPDQRSHLYGVTIATSRCLSERSH